MTSPNLKAIIISVSIAVLGFLILQFAVPQLQLSPAVTFALGAILAGFAPLAFSPSPQHDAVDADVTDTKTLYVGNLPYRANEHMVKELFEQHGTVFSVRLLKDKHTGKRRGFGFVEVALKDADKIIDKLNDNEYQERTLKVREAKQKQEGNA